METADGPSKKECPGTWTSQWVKSVREVTEAAAQTGVKYLTLYAFSTEKLEPAGHRITALMTLLVETIKGNKRP